jgi:hypothetical protein
MQDRQADGQAGGTTWIEGNTLPCLAKLAQMLIRECGCDWTEQIT